MSEEVLYVGRLENWGVGFAYASTAGVCSEAVRRHDCDPAAAHVLSRALTAGLLSAATLPPRERLNVHWRYSGRLHTVLVDAGPDGSVRGLIDPAHLQEADTREALLGDSGSLHVVRSADGRVVAAGHSRTGLQDVVDDLALHHCTSDQVETASAVLVAFNADPERPVRLCRGLLLQALPGCDLELFDRLRGLLGRRRVRGLLARETDADSLFEDVLNGLVHGGSGRPGLHVATARHPVFRCACRRAKLGAVVRALPFDDRADIVSRREDVVVACHYCGERYRLTVDECVALWNEPVANRQAAGR